NNRNIFDQFTFDPYRIHHFNQVHRFITHGLIHADWVHLTVNMFVLLSFGVMVEGSFVQIFGAGKGEYYYIILYVGGILLSSSPSYGKYKDEPSYSAVGASGAISAVVFASILISPLSGIRFIFIPFDIPAFVFGILYLAYSAYMSKKSADNIGHDAHFWGALFGLAFTIILKPALFNGFIYQISTFTIG
ncbi:MAG: rhomboid family intramembrane serine protease, partial [Lentimicrobiaceae bacterium]